jgi:hypothetical protein
MHTLFDFITHIKGVEYILALLSIAGFIVYLEILKPEPLGSLLKHGGEDLNFIRSQGFKGLLRFFRRLIAAPFLAVGYLVTLSFGFIKLLIPTVFKGLYKFMAQIASLGRRPAEAYLGSKNPRGRNQER